MTVEHESTISLAIVISAYDLMLRQLAVIKKWALIRENMSSSVCEQQRRRPTCTDAQSDQSLC